MTPLLEAADIHVDFGGIRAVDGVSFRLERGKLYGLIGPNGSGKTTTLDALSCLTRLTSGTLSFDGQRYEHRSAQALMHMGLCRTFQTVRLLPTLTVLGNVMLGADVRISGTGILRNWLMPWRSRRTERECREAASAAIDRLDLAGVAGRTVGELSYGMRRRVEIARSLAAGPRLLLLDEPAAGMNRREREEIGGVVRQMRDDGIVQVLVEHDVQMITDLCDQVFVMNFGKLIAEGTPASVVSDVAVREAYLGKRRAPDVVS